MQLHISYHNSMRAHRASLRKSRTALAQKTSARDISVLDIWLARASSLSQPLLLCLAVFGYFYTVLPIYQKELLSEQIAKKEIELTSLQRTVSATQPAIHRLESERAGLEIELQSLRTKKVAAEHQVVILHERQAMLETKNKELDTLRKKLTKEVATVKAASKAFSMRAYHDSFSGSVHIQYLHGLSNPYNIVESPTHEAIAAYLLTPYAAVSSALTLGDSKFIDSAASVPRQVKDEYHARVRAALKLHRKILENPQDDASALLIQIKESLANANVDPTPEDRFNERLYETKARLVKILQDSRQKEWDRTNKFLESLSLGIPK